jgi:hypothetical protein
MQYFIRLNKKNKTISFGNKLLRENEIEIGDKFSFVTNTGSDPVTVIFNPPAARLKKRASLYEIAVKNPNHSPLKAHSELVMLLWNTLKLPNEVDSWDFTIEKVAVDRESGIVLYGLVPESV